MHGPARAILAPVLLVGTLSVAAACSDNDTNSPPAKITYTATLAGANERPNPVTSTGTGTFTGVIDPTANTFSWTVNYSNLGSNVTLGHIHGPADAATTAGIIINFDNAAAGNLFAKGATSGTATGSVSLSGFVNSTGTVSGDSLRKLLDAGLTYANIHTTGFGGGEIRGQITRQ